MWRNATEIVVEKLLQDWDLTEEKIQENGCSVSDAASLLSGRDVPQHHQLLDGVGIGHWSEGWAVSLKPATQAVASTERLPEQG